MLNIQKEQDIQCPYCGEAINILIDCSIEYQEYIEDCFVCCRPIKLVAQLTDNNELTLLAFHEDE